MKKLVVFNIENMRESHPYLTTAMFGTYIRASQGDSDARKSILFPSPGNHLTSLIAFSMQLWIGGMNPAINLEVEEDQVDGLMSILDSMEAKYKSYLSGTPAFGAMASAMLLQMETAESNEVYNWKVLAQSFQIVTEEDVEKDDTPETEGAVN